jgi:hypothetical protein
MTFQPGANVYTQGFGSRPENVEVPHLDVRAPTSTDILYPVGKKWVDQVGNATYELTSFSTSGNQTSANWQTAAGGSSELSSLGGNSGTATPTGGKITISGASNQINSVASGSTVALSLVGPYTPSTYTAHGVLVGEGTSSIVATAVGTTGQVLIGATGANPAFATLGTNSGLTAHGVVIGEGNSPFAVTAAGATGQALVGNTGADPTWTGSPSFSGTVTAATGFTATTGAITATDGSLGLLTAGNKIVIGTGVNASIGVSAAMTAGSITISTNVVTASSIIFLTANTPGGTQGNLSAPSASIVPGVSFVINSDNIADTSTVNWWIIN